MGFDFAKFLVNPEVHKSGGSIINIYSLVN